MRGPENIRTAPDHPHEKQFLCGDAECDFDVEVALGMGCPKVPRNCRKVFDCGEGWRMFAGGEGDSVRHILLKPGGSEEPAWRASFSGNVSRVRMYCGEQVIISKNGVTRLSNPVGYPLSPLLSMYFLSSREGLVMHAAGLDIHGHGVILAGESGAGKSTLAGYARKDGWKVLSDDRIVLRREANGSIYIYGTPWLGETALCGSGKAQLKRIAFLKQGRENRAHSMSAMEKVIGLLKVVSVPWYDREAAEAIVGFCGELAEIVECVEFEFNKDADPVMALG